ncbi:MAG: G8 domain-containing protein, partial [Planctomycetales bacterium]|nr:G8 domain-containing protein [Planctomycetales bacterium]
MSKTLSYIYHFGFVTCLCANLTLSAWAAEPAIESQANGNWSSPDTWLGAHVPAAGDSVLIRSEHHVTYDVDSTEILRAVHISGSLRFRTDLDTRLEAGLIRIEAGDRAVEEGFNCDRHDPASHISSPQPELLVGTAQQPVEAEHRCLIRLHPTAGVDEKSWPAIVCCGGRMEIHGAPMNRTWVKLSRTADAGATRLFLSEAVTNWRAGDRLLITGTARQEPIAGVQTEHVSDAPTSEVRFLTAAPDSSIGMSMAAGSQQRLLIDKPLRLTHRGGQYSAEVANLSRNVVVESAAPEIQRGHTMYHHGSTGSISYAEFRHLGKEGVLGRYPIHFHLVGQSMRGSSVIGASVWDSGNRWITIHGTQYLVVR